MYVPCIAYTLYIHTYHTYLMYNSVVYRINSRSSETNIFTLRLCVRLQRPCVMDLCMYQFALYHSVVM